MDQAPSGLAALPTLHWGSHVGQIYGSADDLRAVLVPYFKAGLENHERCLWITGAPFEVHEARSAMRAVLPDFDARELRGQIEIGDTQTFYRPDQEFEPATLVEGLLQRERDAVAAGYRGLRTNGNCGWVDERQWASFCQYEALLQKTVPARRMICMCSYHRGQNGRLEDLLDRHDIILRGRSADYPDADGAPAAPPQAHARVSMVSSDQAPASPVFITEQLDARPMAAPDHLREKLAMQVLAAEMVEHPAEILPRLVKLAMDFCDGASAGVSVLEPDGKQFRWLGLTGRLARFEGARTPRHDSPCGECLDQLRPILLEHPERIYGWIRDAMIEVPEVLLVPLLVKGQAPVGTLWIVTSRCGHFNRGHARAMTELAGFAGLALRMIQDEDRLRTAFNQQETLAREMNHRIKNLFALFDGMVRMTARNSTTPEVMSAALSGRLRALATAHDLVRRASTEDTLGETALRDLTETILRPHDGTHRIAGPHVTLGRYAASDLALILHELATNASKYGALSTNGTVDVAWRLAGTELQLTWVEIGGPPIDVPPAQKGFGSKLAEMTAAGRLGGDIEYIWQKGGLRVAIILPLANLGT